jgi:hypothetical protein
MVFASVNASYSNSVDIKVYCVYFVLKTCFVDLSMHADEYGLIQVEKAIVAAS